MRWHRFYGWRYWYWVLRQRTIYNKFRPENVWNLTRPAVIGAENICIPRKGNLQKLRDRARWWVVLDYQNVTYLEHVKSEWSQKHVMAWLYYFMLCTTQEHHISARAKSKLHMHMYVWLVKTVVCKFFVNVCSTKFEKKMKQKLSGDVCVISVRFIEKSTWKFEAKRNRSNFGSNKDIY